MFYTDHSIFDIKIFKIQENSTISQEGTSTDIKPGNFQDGPLPSKSKFEDRNRFSRKDDIDIAIEDGYRYSRQIDRTDSLLGAFNVQETSELPLHDPTGEKTRKTYDFTRMTYSIQYFLNVRPILLRNFTMYDLSFLIFLHILLFD